MDTDKESMAESKSPEMSMQEDCIPDVAIMLLYEHTHKEQFLGLPVPFIVFVICALIGEGVLRFTPFGRYVYATGSNTTSSVQRAAMALGEAAYRQQQSAQEPGATGSDEDVVEGEYETA